MSETGSGDEPSDLSAGRDLREAARRARGEADRARRLASTQTQEDLVATLRAYAEGLEREAVLFEQQAAEFAEKMATTRRLTEEIKQLSVSARTTLKDMADRLKKPG